MISKRDTQTRGVDLSALRAFSTLATERRFTKAAKVLGIEQSTLSRQIQRLEREFDAKLVLRTSEGAVLTDAGERLINYVDRALTLLDSAKAEIADLSGTAGVIRLGCVETVGIYVLPTIVAQFHASHPSARVWVRKGLSEELEESVARGDLDLAIMVRPVHIEGLTAVNLWEEDFYVAVPKGHKLWGAAEPIDISELVTETFVVTSNCRGMPVLEQKFAQDGKTATVSLKTDDYEDAIQMVEAGLGITIAPYIMTLGQPRPNARLARLTGLDSARQVVLIHRGTSYLNKTARNLRDVIRLYAKNTLQ